MDFSGTKITDLCPIAGLTQLQELTCSETEITDLGPIAGLTQLQTMYCSETKITDLGPIAGLIQLQTMYCSETKITDLGPIAGLTQLQTLYCSETEITDIGPLEGLTQLQTLDCYDTQITDLSPLEGLTQLQNLICWGTQITDLSPIEGLTQLQNLGCGGPEITDLSPIEGLTQLQELTFCDIEIQKSPAIEFWFYAALKVVDCYYSTIKSIPTELLTENCLDELRAHFRDLGLQPTVLQEAKLMVLGNGRVGKTQLCRRLRGEAFEEKSDSTHGICLSSVAVLDEADAKLNIWDFGGQDIYHGTHALFMRSQAVFMLLWTPGMENQATHVHQDMQFRNFPLTYWLTYIQQFAGEQATVIVVQTQCDSLEQEIALPEDANRLLQTFRYKKTLHYSAKTQRGKSALQETLHEAYSLLDKPLIGPGRLKVKQYLENLIAEDAKLPPFSRQNPMLQKSEFERYCQQVGGVSSPDLLLEYLHHCGTIFYKSNVFDGRIILDQSWALEAIYSIFNRNDCYRFLLQTAKGRFRRADLGLLIWNQSGFTEDDQQLFLTMMLSCGICFPLNKQRFADIDEHAEFLAPDLLPESPPVDLPDKWQANIPIVSAEFDYIFSPDTLLRSLMSTIGTEAGLAGDYWRGGFFVPERTTGSRALITLQQGADWSGKLLIQTQGNQAEVLLNRLIEELQQAEARNGLAHYQKRHSADLVKKFSDDASLEYIQEKPANPEYYVSYAWDDDHSESGKKREVYVDEFCTKAAEQGVKIHLDKTELQVGDSITRFMQRLAKGNRIYIFLGDKYLKSPNCMYELSEIWRFCQQDEDRLIEKTHLFVLDDASIWKIEDRVKHANYWQEKSNTLNALINKCGYKNVSQKDFVKLKKIDTYASCVGEVLTAFADRLQARTFDEFLRHAF